MRETGVGRLSVPGGDRQHLFLASDDSSYVRERWWWTAAIPPGSHGIVQMIGLV
ncbi:MAG: hypothetical protein R3E50_01220 [Halioglobus sp.]